jgi:hypothetical protein
MQYLSSAEEDKKIANRSTGIGLKSNFMSSDEDDRTSSKGIKHTSRPDGQKLMINDAKANTSQRYKQRKSVKEVTFKKGAAISDNVSISNSELSQTAADKLK